MMLQLECILMPIVLSETSGRVPEAESTAQIEGRVHGPESNGGLDPP